MKTINTTCKFCQKPIWMECDEAGLEFLSLEKWANAIGCNRCAEYKLKRRKTESSIFAVCQLLQGCRQNMKGEKRLELEARIREKLETLTKNYCTIICNHLRITNLWDKSFTDTLFDFPERVAPVLSTYVRGAIHEADTNPPTH